VVRVTDPYGRILGFLDSQTSSVRYPVIRLAERSWDRRHVKLQVHVEFQSERLKGSLERTGYGLWVGSISCKLFVKAVQSEERRARYMESIFLASRATIS
jgi:hypothetical protein